MSQNLHEHRKIALTVTITFKSIKEHGVDAYHKELSGPHWVAVLTYARDYLVNLSTRIDAR